VVPVENSTEGAVNHTLDSFLHFVQVICGEVELRIHHHLLVGDGPFAGGLHSFERHRLRKSHRDGFVSRLWHPPDPRQLFAFVRAARQRRGYAMTLTETQLSDLLGRFPAQAQVFSVWKGDRLAAASVGIRVCREVLYHFQGADHADFLAYSPTVQLVESLYAYCQRQGIAVLDLGTSVSEGVARFKRRLGAAEGSRRVFSFAFGEETAS